MKTTLWNKNFTYSFIGTIISAIGGVGLNLGLSVYVYGQTQSTALSAAFSALSFIPQFILPLMIGTYIDRVHPVKVLVNNEIILAIVFLIAGVSLHFIGFHYIFLLVISFISSSLGVVSNLSSSSILPKLMDIENYNRGNSIMSMIYPLSSVIMTPVTMIFINKFGVPMLFILYGLCCFVDAYIESKIDVSFDFKTEEQESPVLEYFIKDVKQGFNYVRKTPSIRSVFWFFVAVMAVNSISEVLLYPHFSGIPSLGDEKYSLVLSVNSAGYLIGGLFLYLVNIPSKKRYLLSCFIFSYFILADGLLFNLPFSILLVTRFLAGFFGSQSANFRISAVQAMVPEKVRGKVNALFHVMISGSIFLSKSLIGLLGERFSYSSIAIGGAVILAAFFILLFLPRENKVKLLYNYDVNNLVDEGLDTVE